MGRKRTTVSKWAFTRSQWIGMGIGLVFGLGGLTQYALRPALHEPLLCRDVQGMQVCVYQGTQDDEWVPMGPWFHRKWEEGEPVHEPVCTTDDDCEQWERAQTLREGKWL